MKPIWVNARFLTQPLTGVQRYAYEVTRRFSEAELIVPGEVRRDYAMAWPAHTVHWSRFRRGKSRLPGHVWEQLALPFELPKNALLFSPGNTGPLGIRHQIVMIHDAAPLEHPEWFGRAFGMWYGMLIPRLARRVRLVLTNSEFSRERIAACTGIPKEKVVAIPLGVDPRFKILPRPSIDEALRKLGLSGPYLLAVGALSSRKNLKRLFEAWVKLADKTRDVRLAVAGDIGSKFSDLSGCGPLPAGVVHLGRVADDQLPALYNGAFGFVYPSLYEGFGLPPLEAMSCGTPVIASNTTAVPETVGDAALLVNPYDTASIADGILRLLDDADLRQSLSEQGLRHARQFTWDRTAQATWHILQEIAA